MISVVVPALNEEDSLPRCLSSLRNQDYGGEYEIIVADNGSTDNTVNVARAFGATVVFCLNNKGVAAARQSGADAARGDIIAQADADTVYPKNWLAKIAEHFLSHPDSVALAGRFVYTDPPSWAWFEYWLRSTINRLSAVLLRTPILVPGATFAFRKAAFTSVGGYAGMTYSADQYGMARRLTKIGKVSYDADFLVSTSSRSVRKPFLVCVGDAAVHVGHWVAYTCSGIAIDWRVFATNTSLRRVAIRVAPVLVLVVLFAYGYLIPTSPVFGTVYYEGNREDKVVALTFDDGPNEPYTSEILNVLHRYGVKATFFVVGNNVQIYPEVAKRIVSEGDVVGNHSYSHRANHALTQYGAEDLKAAEDVISTAIGVNPHLYRPPYGEKSPWELEEVRNQGMIVVTWSLSAEDMDATSAELMADEIVSETYAGGIIHLHDGFGITHDCPEADRSLTVKALPLIIEKLRAEGYEFVTVPELLDVPAYNN